MTTVPLTHGEEWGQRWDFNRLVENHDIDLHPRDLPNVGGITEMMKIAALCETHAVGIIPAFHRSDFHCRAGQLPVHIPRARDHGVQLRRQNDSTTCRNASTLRKAEPCITNVLVSA